SGGKRKDEKGDKTNRANKTNKTNKTNKANRTNRKAWRLRDGMIWRPYLRGYTQMLIQPWIA
ncbi:MAG: hypothetical protein IJZ68_04450, partial [Bacteroidaceae bacterium]|nr:hypothetical protein [Bacteroidaceae bacterium]